MSDDERAEAIMLHTSDRSSAEKRKHQDDENTPTSTLKTPKGNALIKDGVAVKCFFCCDSVTDKSSGGKNKKVDLEHRVLAAFCMGQTPDWLKAKNGWLCRRCYGLMRSNDAKEMLDYCKLYCLANPKYVENAALGLNVHHESVIKEVKANIELFGKQGMQLFHSTLLRFRNHWANPPNANEWMFLPGVIGEKFHLRQKYDAPLYMTLCFFYS